MANEKYPGVPVILAGERYLVPSLSLRQFQENYATLTEEVPSIENADGIAAQYKRYIPIIAIALNRNYPDITEDQLYDWLDLNSFREILKAIQGASGLQQVQPGE